MRQLDPLSRLAIVMALSFMAGCAVGSGMAWPYTLVVGFGTAIICGVMMIIKLNMEWRRRYERDIAKMRHPLSTERHLYDIESE